MRVRTMMIIGLFVILGGASEQQADSERQEPVYLDILGRLNVASGFARAGGFFDAPGLKACFPQKGQETMNSPEDIAGSVRNPQPACGDFHGLLPPLLSQ